VALKKFGVYDYDYDEYRHTSSSKSVWKTEPEGTDTSFIKKTNWDPEE